MEVKNAEDNGNRFRIPINPDLQTLIEAKRKWHYDPSEHDRRLGFLGWHERGYLPHFDAPNVTQLVTWMLADSFPVKRRAEWEHILREPDHCLRRQQLESWLDRGYGPCWLRQDTVAAAVERSLTMGGDYKLEAWAIMPNHVHLVVQVMNTPLAKLLNLWKGRSALQANRLLDRRGTFWEKDYFDTYIRDADHLKRAIRYVESNPAEAGLVRDPKDWPWSSARFRDPFGRLAAP